MDAVYIFGLVAMNTAINVIGTFLLKQSAVTNNPIIGLLGAACYIVGASLFVSILNEQSLSVTAVITSVLGLVAAILIGVHVYQETLSPLRWFGIGLALISVVLISLPVKAS